VIVTRSLSGFMIRLSFLMYSAQVELVEPCPYWNANLAMG